jgi:putative hydrolase of the HAD superfamily
MKARNLLFDLGNVIIDIDVQKTFSALENYFRHEIDRVIVEYECGRVATEIFINSLLKQSHRHVQALDIVEAWNSMLIGIPSYRLEMLRILRPNFNLYLLSNTNALHLEWVYRHLSKVHNVQDFEKQHFHQAYYSHLVGDRKPLPSIFQHIIDDALLTPGNTLYMDDVKENLDAAEQLGFRTYLVKPGEEIAEYLKLEGYY